MTGPLARKLGSYTDLSEADHLRLAQLGSLTCRFKAGRNLIRERDRPESVFLVVEGWAYRYKLLPDGGRQITGYLIPGDLSDVHVLTLKRMDHSIGLLSDARIAIIPPDIMSATMRDYPAIAGALFWSMLVDQAVLREWLVNIGQRDAYSRLAHLFCEMWVRMCQVGLTSQGRFSLPLTQEQIGDTLGLTSVHVNRMLQRMRAEGLISFSGKQLDIHDIEAMKRAADFNPNYLHLQPGT